MRTQNTFTTTIAAIILAAAALFATPADAGAQPAELGIGYAMTGNADVDGSAHGIGVLYDRQMGPEPLTLAFATDYARYEGFAAANLLYIGSGPGVRIENGRMRYYAHMLAGYAHASTEGFSHGEMSVRFGGGLSYGMSERHRVRFGAGVYHQGDYYLGGGYGITF